MKAVIGRHGLVYAFGEQRAKKPRRKPGERNAEEAARCLRRAAECVADGDPVGEFQWKREARFHRERADALLARRQVQTRAEWDKLNPEPNFLFDEQWQARIQQAQRDTDRRFDREEA